MEKLTYEKPVITAVELEDADILTASGTGYSDATGNYSVCPGR